MDEAAVQVLQACLHLVLEVRIKRLTISCMPPDCSTTTNAGGIGQES